MCNDRAGFCIRDGGRQVFETAKRSGSDSNAECGAGYNATFEVPPGAGVLRLLITGVAVGVCIERRCVADGVEVTN